MPKSLSEDLRMRVVEARLSGMSVSEVCARYCVDDNSVYRWVCRYEETGHVMAKRRGGYRQPKIVDMVRFEAFALAHSHCTLQQMADAWGGEVSEMCISRALKRLGWTRKKRLPATANVTLKNAKSS